MYVGDGAAVKAVNLVDKLFMAGKVVTKTVFDGPESVPGVKMKLHPLGVLCEAKIGGRPITLILPYQQCRSIELVEEAIDDVPVAPSPEEAA